MMLFVLAPVQRAFESLLLACEKFLQDNILVRSAGLVLLTSLFWFFREKTFFLGDGYLVQRTLSEMHSVNEISSTSFLDSPLVGALAWNCFQAALALGIGQPGTVTFQLMSICFGSGAIIILYALSRILSRDFVERILIWIFFVAGGQCQLFFGYVEKYTPVFFAYLLFIVLAMLYLRDRIRLIVPAIAFSYLFLSHFGMILMFPVMLFLLWHEFRKGLVLSSIVSLVSLVSIAGAILWAFGYDFPTFVGAFTRNGGHLLPLAPSSAETQAYSLFSPQHLYEVLNLLLLVSPFAVLLIGAAVGINFRKVFSLAPEAVFIAITALCGVGFVALINPDLGLSRDWDIYSIFAFGIILLGVWSFIRGVGSPRLRRRVLIMAAMITLLQSGTIIAVNTDEQRSLQRFELLPDGEVWGKVGMKYSYEELAIFFRDRGDDRKSISYYEKYYTFDSTNKRILANLGDGYRVLGEEARMAYFYEKAIMHGTQVPGAFYNVGAYYAKQGGFDRAYPLMKRSFELDPTDPSVAYGLGVILMNAKHDYESAFRYFSHTLKLDSTFTGAYMSAGLCLLALNRQEQSRPYFERYFVIKPEDPRKEKVLKLLGERK
ncbi:MAG TPA: hypothetical protein VGR15_05460 [Bacteroidota bacterium]|nr:hypothetical protein [Bacteroidota bacterium]